MNICILITLGVVNLLLWTNIYRVFSSGKKFKSWSKLWLQDKCYIHDDLDSKSAAILHTETWKTDWAAAFDLIEEAHKLHEKKFGKNWLQIVRSDVAFVGVCWMMSEYSQDENKEFIKLANDDYTRAYKLLYDEA